MYVIAFLMLVKMFKHVGVSIERAPFIPIQSTLMAIIWNIISDVHGGS